MMSSPVAFAPAILNGVADGEGAVVVLLHPVGLDHRTWEGIVPHLKEYKLVRLDLRGHGASPAAISGMDLVDYAADVKLTLDGMGISRATIIGLSMGGMIAQEFAVAYPDSVDGLVVAACPCTLSIEARDALGRRGAAALAGGMCAVEQETMERWFTPTFLKSGGAEKTRQTLLETSPAAWSIAWDAISRLDTRPRLDRVTAKSLCIAGALDPSAPPTVVRIIADHIRDARFLVIERGPHMMQVETPERLADLIGQFLRDD